MALNWIRAAVLALALLAMPPVLAQAVAPPQDAASGRCGSQPLSIARMSWPSAELLAEIHARILASEFGCEVNVIQGDLAATASSMGSTGEPAVAPELWVNRIADVWNGIMDAQMVRSAAPTYQEDSFEGWFMPSAMGAGLAEPPTAAGLAALLPPLQVDGASIRFISCPIDWACSIINRNLLAAHGLAEVVDIIEPTNRLDMDRLIAEAFSRREAFLFYYWQPNPVLAQLEFTQIDMGPYDEEAAQCLGNSACATPMPSAFPPDLVVTALAERVFTETPAIAGYFQRTSMPLAEMNEMLAQLSIAGATAQAVAERFVSERREIWEGWLGAMP